MRKIAEFVKEVKSEVSKVTWSTRKETSTTTMAILFMVFLAALFFMFVDWIFASFMKLIF